MSFAGYPKESMPFLAALPDKDPDWFKANKAAYEAAVVKPTKAFVVDLGDRLRELGAGVEAQPKTNGSIAPINNDLRFNPDAAPYKDHVMLRFWEGSPKKTAPMLMVRVAPDGIGFASGIVPGDVGRWRDVVDGPGGQPLADAIAELAEATSADVVGEALKKVPSPYAPDHPRGQLLRHKMLQVRWIQPVPTAINAADFVDWCADELGQAVPLHRRLVEEFS